MCSKKRLATLLVALTLTLAGSAAARQEPSSQLLLPHFEVATTDEAAGESVTTRFHVVNVTDQPVRIEIGVHTNWGFRVLVSKVRLAARAVLPVDLRDWLVDGELPDRRLPAARVAKLQAQLTGERPAGDRRYYSTQLAAERAHGYVTVRVEGEAPIAALTGDWVLERGAKAFGDTLTELGAVAGGVELCRRHAVRVLEGHDFGAGTRLTVWSAGQFKPSTNPRFPEEDKLAAELGVYAEDGTALEERPELSFLPLELVEVEELDLDTRFGWLDLATAEASFIATSFSGSDAEPWGAAVRSACLSDPQAGSQESEPRHRPSAELLLPYFEVDASGVGATTRFTVVNVSPGAVPIEMDVFTNWGLRVLRARATLDARSSRMLDLRDWLVDGRLPERDLPKAKIEKLQGQLSGQRVDQQLWSSEVRPGALHGFVKIRVAGEEPAAVLLGDSVQLDDREELAQGGLLVDLGRDGADSPLCRRHALRFVDGRGFDDGTRLVVWSDGSAKTARDVELPAGERLAGELEAWRESGKTLGRRSQLRFLPLEALDVAELELDARFGWLELVTTEDAFIWVRYAGRDPERRSVGLESFCLPVEGEDDDREEGGGEEPEEPPPPVAAPVPGITLATSDRCDKSETSPGPSIPVGDPLSCEYEVRNSGQAALGGLVVTEDDVELACGSQALAVGETTICTASSTAREGRQAMTATATARSPIDEEVTDSTTVYYVGKPGPERPAIGLESAIAGDDADRAPGPKIRVGRPLKRTYTVANEGDVRLEAIRVQDPGAGPVSCPSTALAVGAAMTCQAGGTARRGAQTSTATVTARSPRDVTVRSSDPSHYLGAEAAVEIRKSTNGHLAGTQPLPELRPGDPVEWKYEVTNTGDLTLDKVAVVDDPEGPIDCPRKRLAPSETMTCVKRGIATAGAYQNSAEVSGEADDDGDDDDGDSPTTRNRTDDPGEYVGIVLGLELEVFTNGKDADQPPGPRISVGDPVVWTYAVENTSNIRLTIELVDDRQGRISCPRGELAPGAAMTCRLEGVATAGQYATVGRVTGTTPRGNTVRASDPTHFFGERPSQGGRMTGGGSLGRGRDRIHHGFQLRCDGGPNSLEINWGKGDRFHLTILTAAVCTDDPSTQSAGFDTFSGRGTGRLNGVDGASVSFRFTDAGEPGKNDWAEVTIVTPSGGMALSVSGRLESGNHQAHP